jgi:hypothetical protein
MLYFEIDKPSARYVRGDADPKEAAPAEPIESGIRRPLTANRTALINVGLGP